MSVRSPRAIVILAALCSISACSQGARPRARAQRIGALHQAIGGPHAVGRVGDFLLENDQVRFVIADTGRCPPGAAPTCVETYGRVNTVYGGTLVDADLVRAGGGGQGSDQLAELLPGVFLASIDPTEVRVTADGSDGGAAEVSVTGTGGDLFQMVALLNTGLVYPQALQLRQVYRLEPGKRYVTIETTVKNTGAGAHPFPYLQPSELDDLLGQNIPGVAQLRMSVPIGQFPLFGGEQTLFTPGEAGFDVKFALEDSYKLAGGFPAFPGMVVDYVATRGPGVSYGLAIPAAPENFVNTYRAGYAGQTVTPYSMVLPFSYAGVTGAYMYAAPDQLGPGEERTFTSYFIVGDGDVGSIHDTILELRGAATGSFGGRVVDQRSQLGVAGASVMILRGDDVIDQLETDAGGHFLGRLEPGDYEYVVVSDDRDRSPRARLTLAAGQEIGRVIELAPPATLAVAVVDELGRHAPAKILLLGVDERVRAVDGRDILYSLRLGEEVRPTSRDGLGRFVERAWWTRDGRLNAQVRPGTYELVVSRGPEYELTTAAVTLGAGELGTQQLQLRRAVETPGWIAGDVHLHARASTDSGLPVDQRVIGCAAEGLEVAAATDHNVITDYGPAVASSGLDSWLLAIPGMELTTFEGGHFIGYPLAIDPGSTRGGEFRWAGQTPHQLFAQLRALAIDGDRSVVQIAHPRQQVLGYFAQYFVDAATATPYTPTGILGVFAPYGDEFQAQNFSYDFDAIELITGRKLEDVHTYRAPDPLPPGPFPDPQPTPGEIVVGKDGRPTFPGTLETWMTLLDRGHRATGLGASDSHGLLGEEPGYARTLIYVGPGKDTPGGFSRDDVVGAIRAHRAIATNAPFVDVRIGAARIGDTVVDARAQIPVDIQVRTPSWAQVDRLVVYMNSQVVQTIAVPGGTAFDTTVTVAPTADSWVVVEATGATNMFPVVSPVEFPPLDASAIINSLSSGIDLSSLPLISPLRPNRQHVVTPFAVTNPIWIDRAGDGWQPPRAPLPARASPTSAPPDVRARFEAFPEIAP